MAKKKTLARIIHESCNVGRRLKAWLEEDACGIVAVAQSHQPPCKHCYKGTILQSSKKGGNLLASRESKEHANYAVCNMQMKLESFDRM